LGMDFYTNEIHSGTNERMIIYTGSEEYLLTQYRASIFQNTVGNTPNEMNFPQESLTSMQVVLNQLVENSGFLCPSLSSGTGCNNTGQSGCGCGNTSTRKKC